MNHQRLALYGLKWNPFSPELPTEALFITPKRENFCWRIEQAQVREGGFALIHGDPGTGKSVALRVLADRLAKRTDLTVGVLSHPQSNLLDPSTGQVPTANWATSSASALGPITAGPASKPCANAGVLIWRPPACAPCYWSMRHRR